MKENKYCNLCIIIPFDYGNLFRAKEKKLGKPWQGRLVGVRGERQKKNKKPNKLTKQNACTGKRYLDFSHLKFVLLFCFRFVLSFCLRTR